MQAEKTLPVELHPVLKKSQSLARVPLEVQQQSPTKQMGSIINLDKMEVF